VALFQLEGSSTEESEFEYVRFSKYRWPYSKSILNRCLSFWPSKRILARWLKGLEIPQGVGRPGDPTACEAKP
jgi:hypothetical protein